MKPINDIIVIEPIKKEVTLESGMVVASSDLQNMRYMDARVIAVSPEIPSDLIKEGDEIMYDKNNSHSAFVDGTLRTLIRKRDVVVVL